MHLTQELRGPLIPELTVKVCELSLRKIHVFVSDEDCIEFHQIIRSIFLSSILEVIPRPYYVTKADSFNLG